MPPMNALNGKKVAAYHTLRDVTKSGPVMGFYRGVEINQYATDRWHRNFEFIGVASRRLDGGDEYEALTHGEFILPPGLVYRMLR